MTGSGRLVGGWAFEQFLALAHADVRRSARAARRARAALLAAALGFVVFGWSTAAVGSRLGRPRFAGTTDLLLVALVLATFGSARSAIRAFVRLRVTRTRRRHVLRLAASSLPSAAVDPLVGFDALGTDAGYWFVRAVEAYRAAAILERFASSLTWWHEVRLAGDPAIVFDHLGVGAAGVVAVHHIVMPGPAALTVDTNIGLSCRGVPITGFGADLMGWQLRAASSAARAAGLPLAGVTSIAVVGNAPLLDTWGAPTGIERLQHRDSLVRLTYCVGRQMHAALDFDIEVDADTAVLAAHQLADAVDAANLFHQSPPAVPRRARGGRRYELPQPEVNHARPNTTSR